MSEKLNIAIIGAGLIGKKRAEAAKTLGLNIKYVYDINKEAAKVLAEEYGGRVLPWQDCISDPSVDIIFVTTSHDVLHKITLAALKSGKHVLVEKPGGRSAKEITELIDAQKQVLSKKFVAVKVGYNHRFHPIINEAKTLIDKGTIGSLLYMTGEYGHGGREGMEKEWRCSKSLSGGGELLDQGSHLIDLYQWYFGNISSASGLTQTYSYKSTDPVEDNAFILLKNQENLVGHFHISWTMWKNSFQFKITGTKGVIVVSGLGKSYGTEQLKLYKRGEAGKLFLENSYEGDDLSFINETKYFLDCINKQKQPKGNLYDALESMKAIEKIYEENKK